MKAEKRARDWVALALLYGNYTTLAQRCLDSWRHLPDKRVQKVAICNEVCPDTANYVASLHEAGKIHAIRDSFENRPKYQYMRMVFNSIPTMGSATKIMWFDDDSYLRPAAAEGFLELLDKLLAPPDVGMVGSSYTIPMAGNQWGWVREQPWCDRNLPRPAQINFLTGGWWCAKRAFFTEIDYPWAELQHNGGDTMLGVCCQHKRIKQISLPKHQPYVAINADDQGCESKAPRRGRSEPPLGYHYPHRGYQ